MENINIVKEEFLTYMKNQKGATKNTLDSYARDIEYFNDYLEKNGVSLEKIEPINIIMFINSQKRDNKSIATLNRTLSSVNTFIKYAYQTGTIKRMVTVSKIAMPVQKKEKQILTKGEVEKLRGIIDGKKPAAKRDALMFEIMYTTGLKPTDLVNMKMEEVNLDLGYITVSNGKGGEEIKNLEKNTLKLAKSYVEESRNTFFVDETKGVTMPDNGMFFLNRSGEKLSRQSVWKTFKKYADKAEVDKDLSSNILYDSYLYHKADR